MNSLWCLVLFVGAVGLTADKDETFRNYAEGYANILLVCVYDQEVESDKIDGKYVVTYKATVVRSFKGKWATADRIEYYVLRESQPTLQLEDKGELFILFVDAFVLERFRLNTGSGWSYESRYIEFLDQL